MKENTSLIELDLRLTECGQESEFIINQILKKNYEADREERIKFQNNFNNNKITLERSYSHIF
jgi:hypothetical protein